MTSVQRELWIDSVFVVEWDLLDTDGEPIDTATVVGIVELPSGSTATMVIDHAPDSSTYRASYQVVMAGKHGYKMTASGDGVGAIGGSFVVDRDVTGAPPIVLDETTAIGQMRLLTTDVDEAFPILTDPQYAAFLSLEGGIVKKGAAAALEAIGTSETLRSKKITTQDLSIDGPAVADDLRKRAKLLRDQVRQDIADQREDDEYADTFGFDFVDYDPVRSRWPQTAEGDEWW